MNPKLKAFAVHLLVSLIIFSGLFSLLLLKWYPEPYFTASGGWQGLKIVGLVDIVLGPLLTLVVYSTKKNRKQLLADYSLIILLQLSALAWGLYTVYQNRPVAIVWWDDRFYTVSFNSLHTQDRYAKQLRLILNQDIPAVVIPPPSTSTELGDIMSVFLNQGIPPQQQLERYRPIDKTLNLIRNKAVDPPPADSLLWLTEPQPADADKLLFFRLDSAFENLVLAISTQGKVVGYSHLP